MVKTENIEYFTWQKQPTVAFPGNNQQFHTAGHFTEQKDVFSRTTFNMFRILTVTYVAQKYTEKAGRVTEMGTMLHYT